MRDPGPGGPRDDAPRPDWELVVAEQQHAVTVEDHEDLLLDAVAVQRRRLHAGLDDHVLQSGPPRADRAPEVASCPRHPCTIDANRLDVVNVATVGGRSPGVDGSLGAP